MVDIRITAGPFAFTARLERAAAPRTCAKFRAMLPYRERLIHVRWSGEACWIQPQPFDLALVIPLTRTAEPVGKQVMGLQLAEHSRPLPRPIAQDAGHRQLRIVVEDRLRYDWGCISQLG